MLNGEAWCFGCPGKGIEALREGNNTNAWRVNYNHASFTCCSKSGVYIEAEEEVGLQAVDPARMIVAERVR